MGCASPEKAVVINGQYPRGYTGADLGQGWFPIIAATSKVSRFLTLAFGLPALMVGAVAPNFREALERDSGRTRCPAQAWPASRTVVGPQLLKGPEQDGLPPLD